jgi:hypothetical protein
MRSLFDLTTAEAHALVVRHVDDDVPPLDAVENEDWGRDFLLQKLADLPPERLLALGLCLE